MKLILDTNIIVSALLSPQGLPARILNLVLNGSATIVYDNKILYEYMDVLGRDRLKINQELKKLVVNFIEKEGIYAIAKHQNIKFNDENDKMFYELFNSGNINYLVTGNKKHFPKEKGIVTPKEFIKIEYNV
jgi:putative PIN family toxin of toxin-antitoxin system